MGSRPPLGTGGDLRRRLVFHHVPLAFASAVVLVLFMRLPLFDTGAYPHGDIFSATIPRERGEGGAMGHGGEHTGPRDHDGGHTGPSPDEIQSRSFVRQFTVATGYVALGLLGLTLVIGPANLLLRRRNPVSNYLSRDVGTWAAIGSVVHVIVGLQVHGRGRISDFLDHFVATAARGSIALAWGTGPGLLRW